MTVFLNETTSPASLHCNNWLEKITHGGGGGRLTAKNFLKDDKFETRENERVILK
jgi:hypothetical protein